MLNWEGGASKGLIMNPRLIHATYGGKAEQIISVKWLNVMEKIRKITTFDVHIQGFTIAVAFLS